MRHVVMFSGGIGSWAAAKRVAERHGTDSMVLLFTDTLMEDEDTYRFLHEAAENVGAPLEKVADGRTIWEVFEDTAFLGNNRVAKCSHVLKQEVAARWLDEHCDPAATVCYVGIDWTEAHRYERVRDIRAVEGWRYEAPLCEPPYLMKDDLHAWAASEGLEMQRLYKMGMPHANCGGGCVRMGQGGFARLLAAWPERFREWEENEERIRRHLGRDDISILRDRRGGTTDPLTLRELRERIEGGGQCDMFDIGGCGCFLDVPHESAVPHATEAEDGGEAA